MNILITGGTGFIGKVLVNKLLIDENNVTILTRDEKKVDNSLKGKVKILQADICNSVSLERLVYRVEGIDTFIHLAACLDYYGDKRKLFQVNVCGTINLLKWAEKNGIKKFIFTSTIEAMGTVEEKEIPADETLPCKPVSTYGESKLEAEKQVTKFANKNKFSTIILRLGNVYGPGSPAFIVPIANAILKKDNLFKFLPVYKDRYLHLVYIEDVVDGILKAVQKNDIGEIYILAGEEYVTIETLFELIAQGLNTHINLQIKKNIKDVLYLVLHKKLNKLCKRADLLTYFMAGKGGRIHRAYSIEKAKKELGYSPKVSLTEGIKKTIQWAKENGLLTE